MFLLNLIVSTYLVNINFICLEMPVSVPLFDFFAAAPDVYTDTLAQLQNKL